jgi:hypothetical protein
MLLNRLSGDEQPLGELDVAETLSRQFRGAQLAHGQCKDLSPKPAFRRVKSELRRLRERERSKS